MVQSRLILNKYARKYRDSCLYDTKMLTRYFELYLYSCRLYRLKKLISYFYEFDIPLSSNNNRFISELVSIYFLIFTNTSLKTRRPTPYIELSAADFFES